MLLQNSFILAESRSTAKCRVNRCIESYQKANHRLETAEKRSPDVDFSQRCCKILLRSHRCLHKTRKGCRGDLLFHSVQHLTERNLERTRCISDDKPSTQTPEPPVETMTTVPSIQNTKVRNQDSDECSYHKNESNFKHCGMFGDPHLRTFSDRFYTCSVKKAWHLIDNDYMVVMATNVPVREGSEATVTTKVRIA